MATRRLDDKDSSPTKTVPVESTRFLPLEETLPSRVTGFLQTRSFSNSSLARSILRSGHFQVASVACTVCAFAVFLLNLSIFAWATAHNGFPSTGRQKLYQGSCETATRLNSGLHFLINILGTLLLSCGGYCMQYLSAPTRDEVTRAHAKGKWLDIGVLSMRNLVTIEKKRAMLWLVLAATSLPFHVFYNSMVFMTYSSTAYWTLQVSSGFVNNASGVFTYEPQPLNLSLPDFPNEVQRMRTLLRQNALERLSPIDCINAYNVKYQSKYGSVLLVSSNATAIVYDMCQGRTIPDYSLQPEDYCKPTSNPNWICDANYRPQAVGSGDCLQETKELQSNASDWKPVEGTIKTDYCLVERKAGHCSVQSSSHVAIIILALNLTKAIAMLLVSWKATGRSLITIGDGICSFLETPDQYTKGMCLASYHEIRKMKKKWIPVPKTYTPARIFCFSAAGKRRWIWCIALYSFTLIISLYSMKAYLTWRSHDLILYGFGTSGQGRDIIIGGDTADGLLYSIIFANLLQVWLSLLYFATNGFLTAVCAQAEWSSYAKNRKGLRVSSNRRAAQRSTYFLQTPFRYSIPLLLIFGVAHWLVSQSVFMKDELWTGPNGDTVYASTNVGFSPFAILITLAVLALLFVSIVVQGLWRTTIDMPLLRSCSAVIAAACQPMGGDAPNGAVLNEVQWGVMCEPMESNVGGIGHCAFSTGYVDSPITGRMYAG